MHGKLSNSRSMKTHNQALKVMALAFLLALQSTGMHAQYEPENIRITEDHPRLMMKAGEEDIIRQKIETDEFLMDVHEAILRKSEGFLNAEPLQRIKIGKRLLDVSRSAFKQIYYMAYSYRMTGDVRFARQVEKVMLQVCGFTDWNPTHFLDVAEMTAAVAIGYDWTYDQLSEESRRIIREGILEKGIYPSLPEKTDNPDNLHWLKKKNNWNAVCNMGMAWGSIAIYEDCPELASTVISRSITSSKSHTLLEYGPDGNYPEGYMYWNYGTGFLTMLADAVEKATNLDFGLASDYAFMRSGEYMLQMTTQDFGCFAYSDCNVKENTLCIPLFWMAAKQNDLSLLYGEASRIKHIKGQGREESLYISRYLPSLLIWAPERCLSDNPAPKERLFVGQGETPIAILRNHHGGDDEIFVGLKGGACKNGHSHMDIGSFVMYKGKNRWFEDLGHQEYNSLEKEGIRLNQRTQYSSRWIPFLISMYSHNLIIFSDSLQRVEPRAFIDSYGDKPDFVHAASDLSAIQGGLIESHVRGVAIVDDSYVVIRDEIKTGEKDMPIRWAALTPASVEIISNDTAVLTKGTDKLYLKAEGCDIKLETYSTDPPHYYDKPHPGTIMIGFQTNLKAGTEYTLTVSLIPEEHYGKERESIDEINNWKE